MDGANPDRQVSLLDWKRCSAVVSSARISIPTINTSSHTSDKATTEHRHSDHSLDEPSSLAGTRWRISATPSSALVPNASQFDLLQRTKWRRQRMRREHRFSTPTKKHRAACTWTTPPSQHTCSIVYKCEIIDNPATNQARLTYAVQHSYSGGRRLARG